MGSGPKLAGDVSLNSILSEEDRAKYQDPVTIRSILSTAKTIANIESGDLLYWVGSVAQFELGTSDRIDFDYSAD